MNFKLPYPWIEEGRKCNVYFDEKGEIKKYEAEIINCSITTCDDWYWCKCKLDNGKLYWVYCPDIEPVYTIDEIMQYADKTIIEEHWIDFNGDERALYLKKFCGEYFKIDEHRGNRKMERVKIQQLTSLNLYVIIGLSNEGVD